MIPYILHVTVILTVCFIFYKVLLQKETFFHLNRWTLLACLAVSFALPLVPVPPQWSWSNSYGPAVADFFRSSSTGSSTLTPSAVTPTTSAGTSSSPNNTGSGSAQSSTVQSTQPLTGSPVPTTAGSISPQSSTVHAATPSMTAAARSSTSIAVTPLLPRILHWLYYFYLFGVILFALNLLLQVVILVFQSYTRPVVRDGRFRIVETTGDRAPCSFANNIFINPSKYDWDTYQQILLHEKIHVSQRHTLDILLADQFLLRHHAIERSAYQMSLLKVSAPHLPLGITTNYNQSLLKRRILMMNSKHSSIHTIWKYFFLLPLLTVLVCALNKPAVFGQSADADNAAGNGHIHRQGYGNASPEGSWFATTKADKLCFDFKSNNDDHSWSNNSCILKSELTGLAGVGKVGFQLVREAGTMSFTGQFDGEQGYGHYSFKPDPAYIGFMQQHGVTVTDDNNQLAFFLINIRKDYVAMIQQNGYPHVSTNNLIAAKAMNIDQAYVADLRTAGYDHLSVSKLIAFKAQNITGDYVRRLKTANNLASPSSPSSSSSSSSSSSRSSAPSEVSPAAGVNSPAAPVPGVPAPGVPVPNAAAPGLPSADDMIAFKSLDIDSEYVASLKTAGYTNVHMRDLITLKSLGITAAYIKSFRDIGYTNIPVDELPSLKSMDITPEYIKSFHDIGYTNIPVDELPALRSLGITPEFIRAFAKIGYKNIPLNELPALKSMGVTADYVTKMKEKGFVSDDLNKYITLKSSFQ